MFGTISSPIIPGTISETVKVEAAKVWMGCTILMPCGGLLTVADGTVDGGTVELFTEGVGGLRGERYIFNSDEIVEVVVWEEGRGAATGGSTPP